MKKGIVSALLASCVLVSLAACSTGNESKSTESSSNESTDSVTVTTVGRETETQFTPDFSEPNQSIAESNNNTESETSETTVHTGPYTYEAYGYEFSMDINIDDYVFISQYTGNPCFNVYALARDTGWTPHRGNGDTSYEEGTYEYMGITMSYNDVWWYEIEYDDNKFMKIDAGTANSGKNPLDRSQVHVISYGFIQYLPDEVLPKSVCASDAWKDNPSFFSAIINMPNHAYDQDWYVLCGAMSQISTNDLAITREDIVLLAYMMSEGPKHPGENPLYYTDFADSGYDEFGKGRYDLPY